MTVAVAVHVADVVAVVVTPVVAVAWLVTVCACCCPRRLLLLLRVPLATAKVFKKVGKNLRLPRLSSLRFRARFAWCLAHADTFTLSRLKARGGAEG